MSNLQKTFFIALIAILINLSPSLKAENVSEISQESNNISTEKQKSEVHSAQKLKLNHLLQYAFEHNPAIQAARLNWQAKIERYPQATSWPDPMLMYSYFPSPIETRLGPQRHRVTLSQKIPYPGKLELKGAITETNIQTARLEYEKAVRDVMISLQSSYFELSYIKQAIEITKQNQEIINQLAQLGEADYARDVTSLNDVLKAQSQTAQLTYDLILLTELADTEKTKINSLLNRKPEVELDDPQFPDWPAALPYPLDDLYKLAEDNRLELKFAELKISQAESTEKLKQKDSYPDFNVGLMYLEVGEPDMDMKPDDAGKDAFGFSLGINIPFGGKYKSIKREARSNVNKARLMRQDILNQTHSLIKQVYFKLNNAQRLISLYKKSLLPQAKASLDKAETLHREGSGSYAELIETQSIWLNFNLAAARARTDYYLALCQLEKLTGVNLQSKDTNAETERTSP